MKTIGLIASQGGHLQQILRVKKNLDNMDLFLITTNLDPRKPIPHNIQRVYSLVDITEGRGVRNPFKLIKALWQTYKIFRIEEPSLIISTGAGVAIPAFILAKLKGILSIYIESYARIKTLSRTGKICYHITPYFLVQHIGLTKIYPKSQFFGSVYENI